MKETVFNLLPEVTERMVYASVEAEKLGNKDFDDSFNFVHIDDKEYINPKLISFENQFKIIAFYRFLKDHPNITNRTLKEIIAYYPYEIIKDVCKIIPNIIEECKTHNDEKYIPYLYFGLKQSQENKLTY